jgi:predicted Zn-dependent protease
MLRSLHFLRRPRWLFVFLIALAGAGFCGVHAWAWYHYIQARDALARYQNEAARSHLQQCLRVWPRSPAAHLLAARGERRARNWQQAEIHLDECRKFAGAEVSAEAAFEWALLQAARGDLSSVEESLQARLLHQPADAPLIWEALAEGYRHNYRMVHALQVLDTWIQFEPENVHAYFLRGELHRQVGAANRARDEYRQVVERDPTHDEARTQLARCLVQVGHYEEGARQIEILLKKTPGDPLLRTLLARSRYDLGQRAEAAKLLDDVIRAHPEHGPALRERGRLALADDDAPAAEHWYRQACRAMPFNYECSYGLQQALQKQGKLDEAKRQLAHAQGLKNAYERIHEIRTHQLAIRPGDAPLHAELGELLIQTGQPDAGFHMLVLALKLDPNLAAAHAGLARIFESQGDSARAGHHRSEADRLATKRH